MTDYLRSINMEKLDPGDLARLADVLDVMTADLGDRDDLCELRERVADAFDRQISG